jgi:hypothetical protein
LALIRFTRDENVTIYIYIERERERERGTLYIQGDTLSYASREIKVAAGVRASAGSREKE